MTERIAVIGMGQMGSGMAGRLTERGFDVVGYDIDPERRQLWPRRRSPSPTRCGRRSPGAGRSSPACPIRRQPARRGWATTASSRSPSPAA